MLYELYLQHLGTVEDTNVCGAVIEEMLETARRERLPVTEVVNALRKLEDHLIGNELWSEETYARLERWIIESWPEASPQELTKMTKQLHPLEMPGARQFIEARRGQLSAEDQEHLRAVLEDWETSYSQISYLSKKVHRHSLALWSLLKLR